MLNLHKLQRVLFPGHCVVCDMMFVQQTAWEQRDGKQEY